LQITFMNYYFHLSVLRIYRNDLGDDDVAFFFTSRRFVGWNLTLVVLGATRKKLKIFGNLIMSN